MRGLTELGIKAASECDIKELIKEVEDAIAHSYIDSVTHLDLKVPPPVIRELEEYFDSKGVPFYVVNGSEVTVAHNYKTLYDYESGR